MTLKTYIEWRVSLQCILNVIADNGIDFSTISTGFTDKIESITLYVCLLLFIAFVKLQVVMKWVWCYIQGQNMSVCDSWASFKFFQIVSKTNNTFESMEMKNSNIRTAVNDKVPVLACHINIQISYLHVKKLFIIIQYWRITFMEIRAVRKWPRLWCFSYYVREVLSRYNIWQNKEIAKKKFRIFFLYEGENIINSSDLSLLLSLLWDFFYLNRTVSLE